MLASLPLILIRILGETIVCVRERVRERETGWGKNQNQNQKKKKIMIYVLRSNYYRMYNYNYILLLSDWRLRFSSFSPSCFFLSFFNFCVKLTVKSFGKKITIKKKKERNATKVNSKYFGYFSIRCWIWELWWRQGFCCFIPILPLLFLEIELFSVFSSLHSGITCTKLRLIIVNTNHYIELILNSPSYFGQIGCFSLPMFFSFFCCIFFYKIFS